MKESTKQCIRAYEKFTTDFPNYEIDVRLCAFSKNEYNDSLELFNKMMYVYDCGS